MISNCGHDERGKYSGGLAGDQTANEWKVIKWYSRPWNYVLRHTDPEVKQLIAEMARQAAENNFVGYDQNQRLTFWEQLQKANYDPAKINVKCEADCSSGVAAIIKAVGYRIGDKKLQGINTSCYTGNIRAACKNIGFQVLNAKKYLDSDAYLLPGDILLYEYHHVAINLDTGRSAVTKTTSVDPAKVYNKSIAGTYTTTSDLHLRCGAATHKISLAVMPKGAKVKCYGYLTVTNGVAWYYIKYGDLTGFASSKYLKKVN